jgi:V/A-type H+-transporting ATPase subunit C
MSGYDYGNARLRAMKSRLLSRRDLETFAGGGTLESLIAALTKTPYRIPVQTALAHTSGMECIAEALRIDLIQILGKVRCFYSDDAGETVAIVLREYDLHNLKSILRGLSKNIRPAEILSTLIPVNELKYSTLAELVRAPGPRAVIDHLASMNSPFAQPLLRLRAEHPGSDTSRMELVLEQWSYHTARSYLSSVDGAESVLSSALNIDADLANLLTVFRFAYRPTERRTLRDWIETEDIRQLFLGPGFLSFDLLARAANQNSLDAAMEAFAGTRYEPALWAGLKTYGQAGQLSEVERQLRRFRLRWRAEQISSDPLGIGTVLGYCALKVNEVSNLRWIAQGINLGSNAEAIRAEMELIS